MSRLRQNGINITRQHITSMTKTAMASSNINGKADTLLPVTMPNFTVRLYVLPKTAIVTSLLFTVQFTVQTMVTTSTIPKIELLQKSFVRRSYHK